MTDHRFEGPRPPVGSEEVESTFHRLMNALPPELHADLDAICHRRSLQAGGVLLEEGEEPNEIGYVLNGMLGMVKQLPDGRKHIIGLLVSSDMFGRLYDGPAAYRIEALSDSELLICPRAGFEALLNRAPGVERLFLVDLLDELDAAREWVLVIGGPKVVQRAASFLLIICRRELRGRPLQAAQAGDPINLRLTIRRSDLAHYLGTRPESLSRAFHELEDDGIIRINTPHDFDVIDLPALIEAAGNDLVMEESVRAAHPRRG